MKHACGVSHPRCVQAAQVRFLQSGAVIEHIPRRFEIKGVGASEHDFHQRLVPAEKTFIIFRERQRYVCDAVMPEFSRFLVTIIHRAGIVIETSAENPGLGVGGWVEFPGNGETEVVPRVRKNTTAAHVGALDRVLASDKIHFARCQRVETLEIVHASNPGQLIPDFPYHGGIFNPPLLDFVVDPADFVIDGNDCLMGRAFIQAHVAPFVPTVPVIRAEQPCVLHIKLRGVGHFAVHAAPVARKQPVTVSVLAVADIQHAAARGVKISPQGERAF